MLQLLPRLLPKSGAEARALIMINTEQDPHLLAACWPLARKLRICVDGAANRMRALDFTRAGAAAPPPPPPAAAGSPPAAAATTAYLPDVIIGDLDSVAPATLAHYRGISGASSVEVIDLHRDQDSTDLDKALKLAAERGCRSAVVVGTFHGGSRLDHTFGIVQSLLMALQQQQPPQPPTPPAACSGDSAAEPASPNGDPCALESVVVVSPDCTMQVLLGDGHGSEGGDGGGATQGVGVVAAARGTGRRTHVIPTLPGAKSGLVPIDGACRRVVSSGLIWDLAEGMELRFGVLISTSNEATGDVVTVQTEKPLLWTMASTTRSS